MAENPPDWAIDRVRQIAGYTCHSVANIKAHRSAYSWLIAFAQYVSEHEEPPVDPLLAEAIELVVTDDVARSNNQIAAIRERRAGHEKVNIALRALRRGIEIERERQS